MASLGGDGPVARRLAEIGQEFGHGFKLDLSRISAVLDALGRPQARLPPVLHVAGTNGKGSVCALLRAILEASDARVHVFTSPHLVRVNERIRLAGRLADDAQMLDALDRVGETGLTVTYFEAITAAALLLFAEVPAEAVVLEVGLGGRHDATNVVTPAVSVITPVDYDHQAFLGDTLALIAGEKAGVIKAGVPAVVARQAPAAMARIEAEAALVGAPLLRAGVEWDVWRERGRLVVQTKTRLLDLPPPALIGPHQIENAGLAIVAALALRPELADDTLAQGLQRAVWPARMQRLRAGPLARGAEAAGAELWLDGGHNPHAGRAIAASLAAMPARRTTLIVGMLATKDAVGFLEPLRRAAERLIAVPTPGSAAGRAPEEVAAIAQSLGYATQAAGNVEAALSQALSDGAQRVLICGSLYLAGAVLAQNGGVD